MCIADKYLVVMCYVYFTMILDVHYPIHRTRKINLFKKTVDLKAIKK